MNQSTIITNRFARKRFKLIKLFGIILLLMGFCSYYQSMQAVHFTLLLPLLIFGLALGLCFSEGGIKLDPEKKRYKNYFSLLWANLGLWKSLDNYKELVLLRSKSIHPYRSSSDAVVFELYLSSSDHLNLLMIKQMESREKAEANAQMFARMLEIDWVKYNPGLRRPRKVLSKGTA